MQNNVQCCEINKRTWLSKRLLEFLMEEETVREDEDCSVGLKDVVARLWRRYLFKENQSIGPQDNFVYCGGNSVAAVQLALEIEFALRRSFPLLVDTILHGTFNDVLDSLSGSSRKRILGIEGEENLTTKKRNSEKICKFAEQELIEKPIPVCYENVVIRNCFTSHCRSLTFFTCTCNHCVQEDAHLQTENAFSFSTVKIRWKFDLLKCIDSSPLVVAYRNGSVAVLVGSHSGMFAAIDAHSGSPFWKLRLKDRIESSPCISTCGRYVMVGCYDSCLYCFCVETGDCRWIFPTKSQIKSSPTCDRFLNVVYCGSHDQHLYAIHLESGSLKWTTRIGNGSIFSSPAMCKEPARVYAAALDGTLAAVDQESGCILWTYRCQKPIFSSPLVHSSSVCVGCVSGELLFFDHGGICKWIFDSRFPIFCSPCSFGTDRVLVGNHGNQVLCINCTSGSLVWQYQADSQVYSRPCILGSFVVAVTTSGSVCILNDKGQACFRFQVDGQVFSSPVSFGNSLIIGSRNNNLYCYDFIS